jgi:hypothetical protein
MAMTFSSAFSLTLKGTITPADTLAGATYHIGWSGQTFTVPATANAIISRALVTTTGGLPWEPDVNTYNSVTKTDPDGVTVAIDTLYAIALYNTDATNSVTFVCANIDSGNYAGTLKPGGISVIFFPSTGVAIGATSTITLTASAGTPTVHGLLIGEYA